MKLDRDKLLEMVALPDDQLWKKVVVIGKGHGFTLPSTTPPHKELEKLRAIAKDGSQLNIVGAMKLLNKYKGGLKNGYDTRSIKNS